MEPFVKISHISLTARNADRLARFYKEIFGFVDRRPPKRLEGEHVSRGNGLPGVGIYAIWLCLPTCQTPFLEIMEYDTRLKSKRPEVNAPGWGHLAFEVPDLVKTIEIVLRLGGEMQGQITELGPQDSPTQVVYIRDPEGNILELEQRPIR